MSRGISVTFFFDKLNLEVSTIVGIHGDSATMQRLAPRHRAVNKRDLAKGQAI